MSEEAFRILSYVDVSEESEWALTLTRELLCGVNASVVLLTTEDVVAKNPEFLDQTAAQLEESTGHSVTTAVRPGPPREAILQESRAVSPAITIFPPAGRRGLARMIKGSRVKSVVHNSPSSIMVARRPVSESIQRILLTVSGGPMSETTFLCGHELSQSLGAELTILHVRSSVPIPSVEGAKESTEPQQKIPGVSDLIDVLQWKPGTEPKVVISQGMVLREILTECQRGGYDLLILGQHLAVREAGGPFSENLAERLAVESPIPVLVIRPRRWAAGVSRQE